jgi:hypothetical protein
LFLPRYLRLLRHDIYVYTAIPSFVTSRYFRIHRDAIFCCATIFMISPRCHSFVAPRCFRICTNSFRSNFANTVLSCAGLVSTDVGTPQKFGRCTDVEITPLSPRQRAARR